MAMTTTQVSTFITSEITDLGRRAKGLSLLVGNFRQEGYGDDDEEAYAGMAIMLDDIYGRSRIIGEIVEYANMLPQMTKTEIEVKWGAPSIAEHVRSQLEAKVKARGEK